MAPRTFFLDNVCSVLREEMNRPCREEVRESEGGKLKLKIVNSKNLSLEQYFGKPKFKCVYNKLEGYRSENKTFLGRLKGIDSLVDYNWKNFRELSGRGEGGGAERGGWADHIDSNF